MELPLAVAAEEEERMDMVEGQVVPAVAVQAGLEMALTAQEVVDFLSILVSSEASFTLLVVLVVEVLMVM